MNFTALASFLPQLISSAITNGDVVSGVKTLGPLVVQMLSSLAKVWFPNANFKQGEEVAAAALAAFDSDTTKWLQSGLNVYLKDEPGFVPLVVDGIYWRKTMAAVEMAQRKLGLKVDGWAGEITRAVLGYVLQGFKHAA